MTEPIKPATDEPIKPATDEQVAVLKATQSLRSRVAWRVVDILIARIDSDAAKHAAALKERDEQIAELFDALEEAKEDIESWSAYADEYFQTKHDLAGDIARIDAILARRKGESRG